MPDQWIIRVQGKEYGPADVATLREWKTEGRVLATNEARNVDVELWSTAASIPGLFEAAAPEDRGQRTEVSGQADRPQTKLLPETFRIFGKGFIQYFCLTLLVIAPPIGAQLVGALIRTAPNIDADLRMLVEGGFEFCMLLLFLVLWPVYIAGLQILTAELTANRRIGFLTLLAEAIRFWPRVAFLCVFVAVCFVFWTMVPIVIILSLALSGVSILSIFLELLALAFQVWIVGRLFVNFMFWQQFAVLENADVPEALRRSKELARSGRELVWFQRPMWRGVFIASLWFAVVLAMALPLLAPYYHLLANATDPQTLLETLKNAPKPTTTGTSLALWLLQKVLQPLLGIAFVLLYLDSKIDIEQ